MTPKPELYFETDNEWREWLQENHATSKGVYLILYRVSSVKASMRWEEAVRVALCYGWIDSTAKRIDDEKRKQLFTPRKPKSVWSKVNKVHVQELIDLDLMHESGLYKIEAAKKDGSWIALDDVEDLVIPEDLLAAFETHPVAFKNYSAFSRSYRKNYLYWLNSAKRTTTREKRISEIIKCCNENLKMRPGVR
ncbi:YdeI/OmpD-associated family protein [Antarcticibacterium sp. 1MA-6-2]|uniref:YdeI/OmpD-associated family protein n=1 Tax=Antarcticibacterium sp. 1MA-6-2 TaxID=2908210 RepID=UPI001F3EB8F2|nr:YdeI/OmpD-associated family protein [Antarcticibacterium sp. 1MA-6-2]UJH92457.1 YdeI/OmpD-associated family protein [Antarcticibacterium sp. 1MA-6-2]